MTKKTSTIKQASVKKASNRAKPMIQRAGYSPQGHRYKCGGKVYK